MEQVGRLGGQLPERVARAPEGVLLVHPLALFFVLLPALAECAQGLDFLVGGAIEEVAVRHGVEEPTPVLARDVGDEPGDALAVEVHFARDAGLDEPVGVDAVAVQLKAGVVEHKVDAAAAHVADQVPQAAQIVAEDVLLGRCEVLAARRLDLLDVFLGHVDQQRQVRGVAPQRDLRELEEEHAHASVAFLGRRGGHVALVRHGEARRQLEHGRAGAAERIALLAEEHVVVHPVARDGEALVQAAVLVGLGEQPRRAHKVGAAEVARDRLVPQRHVALVVVDDRAQLLVRLQLAHQAGHALDALEQVDNDLLAPLLIQRLVHVLDGLAEDRRKTLAHRFVRERVLVVAAVRGPRRVVRVDQRRAAWVRCGLIRREVVGLRRQVAEVQQGLARRARTRVRSVGHGAGQAAHGARDVRGSTTARAGLSIT